MSKLETAVRSKADRNAFKYFTGKFWWHASLGQITAMNNQQFLAVVGVIIVALIVYLSYERFRECQDLGGSHCYFGRRR